jgi:outer membrane receptor protein involved in Fe transport
MLLMSVAPAFAQAETGQIGGTVTDQTGAVVPNANVTVTSQGTAAVRTSQTGASGDFLVSNLQPGSYTVKVGAANFKTYEQTVPVDPGSKIGLDIKLEVGTSTTVVEVTGSAAAVLVNTETQTVSQVIGNQMLQELPIADTRNPYSLVVTSGNVSEDDPSGRGVGVAINGLRSESTNVLLDGAANNDEFTATPGQYVPLDSVQEYSILTDNFTSEYGRAGAGVVNLTTKAGTNSIHGTAYEYNRVSKLAANDFNNNAYGIPKGIYTRNQFGFSVGGPVKKDKLFFFESTEWTRIRSAAPQINMVPDTAFIALAAPATQNFFNTFGKLRSGISTLATYTRQNIIDSSGKDPCGGSLPSYFTAANPCATLPTSTTMFDEVTYNVPLDAGGGTPQNTYDLVGRGDWNVSNKTTLYGRWARYSEFDLAGTTSYSPYAGYDTTTVSLDNSFLVSVTHTFSPTLVSQSKLVFNRLGTLQPLGTNPDSPSLYFGSLTETHLLNQAVALPGYLPFSPGSGIPFGGPQNFLEFYQDVTKVHGKNDFRFGGAFTYIRDNRTFGAYETPGAALGNTGALTILGVDDFLDGLMHQFQSAVNPQGKFPCVDPANPDPSCLLTLPVGQPNFSRSNRYNELGLYGQDSWKIGPHFTLNLGMRWEYFGTQHNKDPNLDSNLYFPTEPNQFLAIRDSGVATTPNGPLGGLWKKNWHDFGPRLGFAWDVFGDGKTSLRGGWGISYIRNFGNVTFNVIQNPPNYAVISLIGGVDLPQDALAVTTNVAGPLAGTSGTKALPAVSLRAVNPNIATAYAHDFSFGLQREVRRNVVAALEYSGSKGVHLYDIANINPYGSGNIYLGDSCAVPGTFPDCYSRLKTTQYTNINYRSDNGFSRYNALNARVDVRNIKGVNFRVNYTWSHAIDNLSDTFSSSGNAYNLGYTEAFFPKLDSGDAEFDNRHRIAISGVWDVPFAKGTHGAARQVFDGWSVAPIITARTGAPYTIYDTTYAVSSYKRMDETTAIPRNPQPLVAVTGIPNTYSMLNLCNGAPNNTITSCSFDTSYVNPIVGYSDFGPFPSNMTGRDAFRTPGSWNIDLAVHKSFFVGERYKLDFQAQMFDAFNHANLGAGTGSADVGAVTYIPASYGGHRNIQMALRFIF